VDGKRAGQVTVTQSGMYNVFRDKKYKERELRVDFSGKVRVYAYTFG
jgi:hypothetical protein